MDNKSLFIYYSRAGNGDKVAEYLGMENIKVATKKDLPKSFFWGMMVGGFKASTHKKMKLVDFNPDLSKYSRVLIGSPIWADNLSCPINEVLSQVDLKEKEVIFILWSGGGNAKKASKYIKKHYPDAKIYILQEPKKYPKQLEVIKEFK